MNNFPILSTPSELVIFVNESKTSEMHNPSIYFNARNHCTLHPHN